MSDEYPTPIDEDADNNIPGFQTNLTRVGEDVAFQTVSDYPYNRQHVSDPSDIFTDFPPSMHKGIPALQTNPTHIGEGVDKNMPAFALDFKNADEAAILF